MKRTWLVLVVAALSPLAAPAQQAAQPEANPISNYTRQIVAGEAKNLIGAADEMPADKYTLSAHARANDVCAHDRAHRGHE